MGFTDPTSLRVGNTDRDDVAMGLEGADKGEDVWRRVCRRRTIVVRELEICQLALVVPRYEDVVILSRSIAMWGRTICTYENVHDVRCLLVIVVMQKV